MHRLREPWRRNQATHHFPKTPPMKIDAGDFDTWLQGILCSFKTGAGMDVPCGECRGCCSAGRFVHLLPSDQTAYSAIPKQFLLRAPGNAQRACSHGLSRFGTLSHAQGRELFGVFESSVNLPHVRLSCLGGDRPGDGRQVERTNQ